MSTGELHLIIGCMYSGKSTELLRIINNYRILEEPVLAISHVIDNRYGNCEIISHDNKSFPCIQTGQLYDMDIDKYKIIIIEEAQFFDDLTIFVKRALTANKIIYVAGLDGDFQQNKFAGT